MKKTTMIVSAFLLSSLLYACGKEEAEEQKKLEETTEEVQSTNQTFTDILGNKVEVPAKVEKIVTLSPEMLLLLNELGVKVAGTVETHMHLPAEEGVPKVGGINDVNMEKIIELSPDLVIGTPHFHSKLLPNMKQNNIPMAIMQMVTFEDVKKTARLYGKILNIEDVAEQKIAEAEKKVEAVVEKAKNISNKTAVVLNVTPSGITLQKENTTTIDVIQLIGMKNGAESLPSLPDSVNSAPFSIESLVEMQPDYIFITIHGASDAGEKIIQSELVADAAWQSLNAVKNKQTYILPSELFLTNPGLRYDETVKYLVDRLTQ